MNILIIGQCTLHWGRMEFGNIGNYYIMEPFFRELHNVFPKAEISTTMQFSRRFCEDERVKSIPMDLYYNWRDNELELAKEELIISEQYKVTGELTHSTPYIQQVLNSQLIIDFSGDIWGDNANFLGKDRFEVGLLKDKIAQNLGKKSCYVSRLTWSFYQ
jgi:colanic acid/amylovoran biosynthesis protein